MKKTIQLFSKISCFSGIAFFASCANSPLGTSGPGGSSGIQSKANSSVIESKSRAALNRLYAANPAAKTLAETAEGILIFPEIIGGGVIIGGSYGDGTLYQKNERTGFYRSISVDYGFHAGLEKRGYAVFLMDKAAVQKLKSARGWEIGADPSFTLIDQGLSASATSTTVQNGIYAFVFDQKGLKAGLSFTGTKITRLNIGY